MRHNILAQVLLVAGFLLLGGCGDESDEDIGTLCHGMLGGGCADGLFCKVAEGDCFGAGTCERTPDACIELYGPVCGCDGKTYSNSCFAAAAGVAVAANGECRE